MPERQNVLKPVNRPQNEPNYSSLDPKWMECNKIYHLDERLIKEYPDIPTEELERIIMGYEEEKITKNIHKQTNQKSNQIQNPNPISHNYETDYSRKGASYIKPNESEIFVSNGKRFGVNEKRNLIKPK